MELCGSAKSNKTFKHFVKKSVELNVIVDSIAKIKVQEEISLKQFQTVWCLYQHGSENYEHVWSVCYLL